MDKTDPTSKNLLTFPGQPRRAPPLHEDPARWGWTPLPLEEGAPPPSAALPLWLEEQVTQALLRARRFHLAVARLDAADRAAVEGEIDAFVAGDRALFRVLETLRLRRPSRRDVLALLQATRGVLEAMAERRLGAIAGLEGEVRRRFLSREQRSGPSPLDLEEELRRRVARRELPSAPGEVAIRAGGVTLPLPAPDELALRRRRFLRREQESLPALTEAPLEHLLSRLPLPWLKGMLLQLGAPAAEGSRQDLEARGCALLRSPRAIRAVLLALPFRSYRILEALLEEGGSARYDLITHRFGSDDEASWFWDRVPPRGDLERVRRTGLLMVGSSELPGTSQEEVRPRDVRGQAEPVLAEELRLGFIPRECRPLLQGIFAESPRLPWICPDVPV